MINPNTPRCPKKSTVFLQRKQIVDRAWAIIVERHPELDTSPADDAKAEADIDLKRSSPPSTWLLNPHPPLPLPLRPRSSRFDGGGETPATNASGDGEKKAPAKVNGDGAKQKAPANVDAAKKTPATVKGDGVKKAPAPLGGDGASVAGVGADSRTRLVDDGRDDLPGQGRGEGDEYGRGEGACKGGGVVAVEWDRQGEVRTLSGYKHRVRRKMHATTGSAP